MNEFQKRIGVGEPSRIGQRHAGTTKTTEVKRDDKPGIAGTQTEHWSGRVDATVKPEPVRVVASRSERRIVSVKS